MKIPAIECPTCRGLGIVPAGEHEEDELDLIRRELLAERLRRHPPAPRVIRISSDPAKHEQ